MLTMALLTMALLTMALLTMAMLTMAMLTMAILATYYGRAMRCPCWWCSASYLLLTMAGRCAARAGGALLHTCYLLWQGDALPVLVVLSFGASTGYLGCTCPYSWAAKVAPPTDRQAGRQDLDCPRRARGRA
jgi:hypothetical protein